MSDYGYDLHTLLNADLFIRNDSVIKDRYYPPAMFAGEWVLERIEMYLAPGSEVECISYDTDSELTVIGMNGSIHIGQESYQEVRKEVPKVGTWDYV